MNPRRYAFVVLSLTTGVLLVAALLPWLDSAASASRSASNALFVAPAGSGNCSQSLPCDLEEALTIAMDGSTVFVAGGTYTGSQGAVVTMTQSITLYGGWDGRATTPVVRDPDVYPTRLDGEGTKRVMSISGGISPTIDGFVVTGGEGSDGGGIYIDGASPIIRNNVITANRTVTSDFDGGRGGGIFVTGASKAIVTENSILSNTSGYGGGICHFYGTVTLTIFANEVAGNVASDRGGGIMVEGSPALIRANVISGNTATDDGGGLLIWAAAPQVEGNRILDNSADFGAGISMGNGAAPSLLNNLMSRNTRGGIYVSGSSPVMTNNTLVGSGSPDAGDGIKLWSRSTCKSPYCVTGRIANTIIMSYEVGISGSGPMTPTIDYNDLWNNATANYELPAGVATGTHNVSLNPYFVDPSSEDYHLESTSPCIDTGTATGAPDFDIEGKPRDAQPDIGAYEWVHQAFLPLTLRSGGG